MITCGDTFLIPTPPDFITKHLYIVTIVTKDNEALLVNVTTKCENSDNSCVLTSGEHDFIDRDSVINYKDAIKTKNELLELNIKNNKIFPRKPVSAELLNRILKGALISPYFKEGYLEYLPTIPD